MTIIKTENKNGVKIYTVEKNFDDAKMEKKMDKFVKKEDIIKI